jgi:hypothetical protein
MGSLMEKNLLKYPALAVAALLLLTFAAAGSARADGGFNDPNQVKVPIKFETDIPLAELDGLLMYVIGSGIELPSCLVQEIAKEYQEGGSAHIAVDGTVWLNLKVSEKYGMKDYILQGMWSGNILVQVGEVSVLLHLMCFTLNVHWWGSCDPAKLNLNINFLSCGNAAISGACGTGNYNVHLDGKICVRNGKIQTWTMSPEWLATLLPKPTAASFDFLESFFPMPSSTVAWPGY